MEAKTAGNAEVHLRRLTEAVRYVVVLMPATARAKYRAYCVFYAHPPSSGAFTFPFPFALHLSCPLHFNYLFFGGVVGGSCAWCSVYTG